MNCDVQLTQLCCHIHVGHGLTIVNNTQALARHTFRLRTRHILLCDICFLGLHAWVTDIFCCAHLMNWVVFATTTGSMNVTMVDGTFTQARMSMQIRKHCVCCFLLELFNRRHVV
jgi:hypothetical protein